MKILSLWLVILLISFHSFGQQSFVFNNFDIVPGTKEHFKIPIMDGKDSTFIPITVFHGSKTGPVLGITAGVHGYEYPPILAAQELNKQIDPKELSGTIILVQIANVPSFLGRSPYINPKDRKNLNRSFPGKVDGSLTERIAHTITQEVIKVSDYFVDVHGGDAPEDLIPYNAWYQSDELPTVSQKGREMALSMGFDYSIIFNIPKARFKKPSLYCSQEAFHRKIPSIDIECGRLGIPGTDETQRIVDGLFSLLSHLKMMTVSQSSRKKPIIIAKRTSVKSKSTGVFYTNKKAGDTISNGENVGYITDFFGDKLEDIKAPIDGMILYMLGTPPVNQGDTLMNVGVLPKS